MATDITSIINNLCQFYHFPQKEIVYVGAGGGQFIDFGRGARRIVAIDSNADALLQLRSAVAAKEMGRLFDFIADDFCNTTVRGDVVFFEFCLHEMANASKAIAHARALAPDVVVIDHAPGSAWAFYVVEEEKASHSMAAMKQAGIRSHKLYHAEHRFNSYAELVAKVMPQGSVAIERCARFQHASEIAIPMMYGITLL
jgi:hypothetical protein